MLKFVMKVWIHSDKREEFLQTIRLLRGSMPGEESCLSHDWYQDTEDPNSFILFEQWVNGQVLKEHHRSEPFRILLGAVRTLGKLVDIQCFRLPQGTVKAHIQAVGRGSHRL